MDTSSLAQPAHPSTREARGLRLAEQCFEEIYPVSRGTWAVPSCSGEAVYLVRLRHESCTCADHRRRERPCKHVYAALVVRAKSAECAGCGGRSRRRDMVEVGPDSLTFFEGDMLCEGCALDHGEL